MSNSKTSMPHQKRLKKIDGKRRRGEEPCGEKRRNGLLLGLRWHCRSGPQSSVMSEIGLLSTAVTVVSKAVAMTLAWKGGEEEMEGFLSSVTGGTRKCEIRRENQIPIDLRISVAPMYCLTFQSNT